MDALSDSGPIQEDQLQLLGNTFPLKKKDGLWGLTLVPRQM